MNRDFLLLAIALSESRWIPHRGSTPYMCPKCKSTHWKGDNPPKPHSPFSEEDLLRAVSMYAQGKGCIDAARETGVPLEAVILKIRSISDGPVRMASSGQ